MNRALRSVHKTIIKLSKMLLTANGHNILMLIIILSYLKTLVQRRGVIFNASNVLQLVEKEE